MRTKVYRVTVLIVDHDRLGAAEVAEVLENQRFPNDCLWPHVMAIETASVDWSDDHPLNQAKHVRQRAFDELFPPRP